MVSHITLVTQLQYLRFTLLQVALDCGCTTMLLLRLLPYAALLVVASQPVTLLTVLSLSIPTRQLSAASVNRCAVETRLSPVAEELSWGSSKNGPQ